MKRSEQIQELSAALAKAQSEIRHAEKSATNPHFNRTYADLASVWEAIREPLTKNGLSVVQTFDESKGPNLVVETTLFHASGQFIQTGLTLNPSRNDAHGIGAAITYARRYSLMAVVGIAPDDDDGNGAVEGKNKTPPAARTKPEQRVKQGEQAPLPTDPQKAPPRAPGKLSEPQIKRLFAIAKAKSVSHEQLKAWMAERGIAHTADMTREQYDALCGTMEQGGFDGPTGEFDSFNREPGAEG